MWKNVLLIALMPGVSREPPQKSLDFGPFGMFDLGILLVDLPKLYRINGCLGSAKCHCTKQSKQQNLT